MRSPALTVPTQIPHRRPYRGSHIATRLVGPLTIAGLVVALAVLWIVARPTSREAGSFLGQLLGAEGVLLLSVALVLISTLRAVEQFFDGVDKAAVWHRRVAIAGTALVGVHVATTSNPNATELGPTLGTIGIVGLATLTVWAIAPRWRSITPRPLRPAILRLMETGVAGLVQRWLGSYGLWRGFHRLTGIFLALGVVHGLMDASVTPIDASSVEIWLRPLGHRFEFRAGQFAYVNLEAKDGWHRHPFTIASAPAEANVRITVGAVGDFTSRIGDLVEPGMPAVISSPQGHFDYCRGTEHQLWIAGGIGIAPILSWLRSLSPGRLPHRVDLFYTARGPAPLADEVAELAAGHGELHLHLVDTEVSPRLTSEEILSTAGGEPRELSAFLCGPEAMVNALQKDLVRAGVKPANVHREYYNLR